MHCTWLAIERVDVDVVRSKKQDNAITHCLGKVLSVFSWIIYSWIERELQVGTALERRHNEVGFQIWGLFWIPQPKLHLEKCLIFFVKSQNGLDLSSNRCFSESDAHNERKSITFYIFFEKNRIIDVSYCNIAGTREHDIIDRTQISLTSLTD